MDPRTKKRVDEMAAHIKKLKKAVDRRDQEAYGREYDLLAPKFSDFMLDAQTGGIEVTPELLAAVKGIQADLTALKGAADFMAGTYSIRDVEAMAKKEPGFHIPSAARRKGLKPGDVVKLAFKGSDPKMPGERMWVQVTQVIVPGRFEGKLASQPVVIGALNLGDTIHFGAEHVMDIG